MKGFVPSLLMAAVCASALSACGGSTSSSSSAATGTTTQGAVTGIATPKTVSVVTAN